MNIIQKAATLLNKDIETLLPPVFGVDLASSLVSLTDSVGEKISRSLHKVVNFTLDSIAREPEREATVLSNQSGEPQRTAIAQDQENAQLNQKANIFPIRQTRRLEGKILEEILDSLSDKRFQVDLNKKMYMVEGEAVINANGHSTKTSSATDNLMISFRAEFTDKARSRYNFSISIFEGPKRNQVFELDNFSIAIKQETGEYPRTIPGDSSLTGRVIFRGIETGTVCKIVTADSADCPKDIPMPIGEFFAEAEDNQSPIDWHEIRTLKKA